LADQVKSGKFREDLFYRLNVIKVQLPPLSERTGDIFILAQHFLEKYKNKTPQNITAFSLETISVLENYFWPGNVRELENTVERAVILANQEKIQPEDLQIENVESIVQSNTTLRDFEKKLVMKTLAENNKNISKTAKVLEVSRRWLHYRLKEWGHET
jgi:Nif-specific regulatory protein